MPFEVNDHMLIDDAISNFQMGQYSVGMEQLCSSKLMQEALIQVLKKNVLIEVQAALNKQTPLQIIDLAEPEVCDWDKMLCFCEKLCPLLTVCLQAALSLAPKDLMDQFAWPFRCITAALMSVLFELLRSDCAKASNHLKNLLSWVSDCKKQPRNVVRKKSWVDDHAEDTESGFMELLNDVCSSSEPNKTFGDKMTDSDIGEFVSQLNDGDLVQTDTSDTEIYGEQYTDPNSSHRTSCLKNDELSLRLQDSMREKTVLKRKSLGHGKQIPKNAWTSTRTKKEKSPRKPKPKTDGSHQCSHCGKIFRQLYHLKKHIVTHTGDYPYKCGECNKGFYHPSDLKEHSFRHTGENPFTCHLCSKTLISKLGLRLHMRQHSGDRPFKCLDCDKTFFSKGVMLRHRTAHTGETPYACDQCDLKFKRSQQLKEHKYTHSGSYPHVCQTCGKGYIGAKDLKYHIRSLHTNERPFECDLCDKRFFVSSHLRDHRLTHTQERRHTCAQCGKSFIQSQHLKRHEQIHTGQNICICPVCGQKFSRQNYLTTHMQKHREKSPYNCDQCDVGFNLQNDYQLHMKEHGQTPYQCEQCGKAFQRPSALKSHKSVHLGVKPFMCSLCAKCFSSQGSLTKHEHTHSISKPYSCLHPGCEKAFAMEHRLKSHQQTHLPPDQRIKRYPCEYCDKRFDTSRNLERHSLTHTGVRPHSCQTCAKTFSRADNLKSHIKSCHPSDSNLLSNPTEAVQIIQSENSCVTTFDVLANIPTVLDL